MSWKNWCRLCGSMENTNINVFIETKQHFVNIANAIHKLLSININETDIIPTQICHECNTIFNNLIDFYVQSNRIQDMYTEILCSTEKLQNMEINEVRIKYKLFNNSQIINLSHIKNENNIANSRSTKLLDVEKTKLLNYNKNKSNYNIETQISNCNSSTLNLDKTSSDNKYDNSTENICSKSEMEIPEKTTPSKIINCEICQKIFTSNRGFGIHLKTKHSINRNSIECKYCGKLFKIRALLNKHQNTHLPTEKKKFYPCKKCDKKFSSDSGLWSHIHTVHEQNRLVICEECGKEFPTQSYLKSHKLSHKKVNDYQCPKCPMKLKRQKTLMIHLQTHGENFICPICGIQLNTKKTLREHMVVHSDEKNFKCNICNKSFKREKTLNSHLLLHTGLKPYECEFCKKRFTHGSNFRTHQKNLHPLELADREAKGEKRVCKEFPKVKLLKALNKNR